MFADRARQLRSDIVQSVLRSNSAHKIDDVLESDNDDDRRKSSSSSPAATAATEFLVGFEDRCVTCSLIKSVDDIVSADEEDDQVNVENVALSALRDFLTRSHFIADEMPLPRTTTTSVVLSSPRCAQHNHLLWRHCSRGLLESLLRLMARAIGSLWTALWKQHCFYQSSSRFSRLAVNLAAFLASAARLVSSVSTPIESAAAGDDDDDDAGAPGSQEADSSSRVVILLRDFIINKIAQPVVAFAESVENLREQQQQQQQHHSVEATCLSPSTHHILSVMCPILFIASTVDRSSGGFTTVGDSVLRLIESLWHRSGPCERFCAPWLNCGAFVTMKSNVAFWSGYLRNFYGNNTNASGEKKVVDLTTTSTVSHALRFFVSELELLVRGVESSSSSNPIGMAQKDALCCIATSSLRWFFSWSAASVPETANAALQRFNDTCFLAMHVRRLVVVNKSSSSSSSFDLVCLQLLAFAVAQFIPLKDLAEILQQKESNNNTAASALDALHKIFDHSSSSNSSGEVGGDLYKFLATDGSIFSATEQLFTALSVRDFLILSKDAVLSSSGATFLPENIIATKSPSSSSSSSVSSSSFRLGSRSVVVPPASWWLDAGVTHKKKSSMSLLSLAAITRYENSPTQQQNQQEEVVELMKKVLSSL